MSHAGLTGVADLQLGHANSMPISPPSPGTMTEPVLRDVGTPVWPGHGRSVSPCRLRFPLRAADRHLASLSRPGYPLTSERWRSQPPRGFETRAARQEMRQHELRVHGLTTNRRYPRRGTSAACTFGPP